ncbi:MAG: lipopolysaccharide assembly protein LapB [Amphritea sp.]
MFDIYQYWLTIPLFFAVGAGWFLGRREGRAVSHQPGTSLQKEYFAGLDFLLSEKTDEAIESFIRALEINSDTIPAHIALAKLFRKKGDVERAIQIHQNLLARPDLSRNDFLRIQLALARDYFAAGLFDRAENLLQEIIEQRPSQEMRQKVLTLLTKLYEKEREWEQALLVARQLAAHETREIHVELGHYCCELANHDIEQHSYRRAKDRLSQALVYDSNSVRATLMKAEISMVEKNWRAAIKELKLIAQRDHAFIPETVEKLATCYRQLGQLPELETFLRQCLNRTPSTTVMLALAGRIMEQQGAYAAGAFITDELKKRPSIKGFNHLIDLYIAHAKKGANESLMVLRGLTGQLEQSKPIYLCHRCGFSGKTLHWQCPSCQTWGCTKPIQGLEGE